MNALSRFPHFCFLILVLSTCAAAQETPTPPPGIGTKVNNLIKQEGYFDFYWDPAKGKVYLEIDRFNEDFLYVNSLAAGLGSNDIGLDRNQLGQDRVVQFQRIGPKVLLVQRNLDYRAVSDNQDEVASVRDAFAQSVLEGFKIEASTAGRVLIDLTPLLLSDAHGVIQRLKSGKQGTFKLDAGRSAIYLDRTKNFPQNSEFEATLTFTGEATGWQLRSVAPTANSFSLRMHHSFVELPDNNYRPRIYDPRSGYNALRYADYATPIDQPLVKRFIVRHRLEKKDPTAALSEAVEPIVYYLDRGAPEPVRSALLEGGRWWNQAFEAAGYKDAFRVEVLPEGADPLDVRYNVINWVHRSTRGWSYGSSVVDPRTGEILKGHVLLGSLRVRQDFLLAQGLVEAYRDGPTADPRLEEMALARLRQLSAHEIGHTLGLSHNFAASTNGRASVMDYPHPYITLQDGEVDFSQAYDDKIGAWDKRTILYGYQDFPDGTDEEEELSEILDENNRLGLAYLTDADARPVGSAQPQAHLWDNGADPMQELDRLLVLRQHALERFGADNLAPNQPLSELEKVLTPVYLMHRYQVEAVAKQIGGYNYDYAVRGSYPEANIGPVSADRQAAAVETLLATLQPEQLEVPRHIVSLIPPPAAGYSRDRELFATNTGGGLDPLSMAELAADNTLSFLLHPHRLARIQEQHLLYPDAELPDLDDYLGRIQDQPNGRDLADGLPEDYREALLDLVERRTITQMIRVAADEANSEVVRVAVNCHLQRKLDRLQIGGPLGSAHQRYLARQIQLYLAQPSEVTLPPPTPLPDGSPIGCGHFH